MRVRAGTTLLVGGGKHDELAGTSRGPARASRARAHRWSPMKEALQRAEQAASLLVAARWPLGAGRTLLGGEHRRLNGAGTTLELTENVASAGRAQLADDGKRVEPREERFGGLNAAREASARRKRTTEGAAQRPRRRGG